MTETTILTATPKNVDVTLPVNSVSADAAAAIDRYEVNPFSIACGTMLSISQLMEEVLSFQYSAMQKATNRAHITKDMSNRMDEKIAEISKMDENGKLEMPDDDAVFQHMRKYNIPVEGKTIDQYLNEHRDKKDGKCKLNKGELVLIQASLDNSFNADTDLLKQKQIMFDKYTNTYNAMLEGAKSCIDKWGRLLNDIIRG